MPAAAQGMTFMPLSPDTHLRVTFAAPRLKLGRGQRKNRRDVAGRARHAAQVKRDRVGHPQRDRSRPTLRFKCAR